MDRSLSGIWDRFLVPRFLVPLALVPLALVPLSLVPLSLVPLSLVAAIVVGPWLAWPVVVHGPGGKGSAAFEAYEKGQIPAAFKGRRNPLDKTAGTLEAGRQVYQQNCIMCHGANAEGKEHMASMLDRKPADLRRMFRHFPDVDDYYHWIIREGGERFGLPMPGFEGVLTEAQVRQVVTWMQSGFPGAGTTVKDVMHHDHSAGRHMVDPRHNPAMPVHHMQEPGPDKKTP